MSKNEKTPITEEEQQKLQDIAEEIDRAKLDQDARLIDHVIESGKLVGGLIEKLSGLKEDLQRILDAIRAEGKSKCDTCPARNDLIRLAMRFLETPIIPRPKNNKNDSIFKIILSMVSNKFLWIAISLIAILLLVLSGFDVIQLLK